MTVYAADVAKLDDQLSKQKITAHRFRSEGQITLASGQLASVFQERSTLNSSTLNFVAFTEDTLQAAIGHLDAVIKKRPRSEEAKAYRECARNVREIFADEAQVLKQAKAQGAPVHTTSLEESFVSILAKNLG